MFLKRERYEQLIKAEERSLWLAARVSQLETAAAYSVYHATGVPQPVQQITLPGNRPVTPKPARDVVDSMHGKSLTEAMAALNGFSFEHEEDEVSQ